ncbi:hypothetical protein B0H13DRAFT_1900327 [Mycena leptocephala]|nr:hypothetical protein B0H13DRAFT_1900327 [Mycena leptocephala]
MPTDQLQKAEKLWISPDVVILRAQTRIFRVFAVILHGKSSSVFADIFRFLQPQSSYGIDRRIPMIILHDDPEEVEVFQKAIFDSGEACLSSQRITLNVLFTFFMPPPAERECEDTPGALHFAHKYHVQNFPSKLLAYTGWMKLANATRRGHVLGISVSEVLKITLDQSIYSFI